MKKKCANCDIFRLDNLTSLYRREFFLQMYSIRKIFNGGKYLLCVCDIDKFKVFNDKYGHIAGDFILRKFAESILSSLGKGEFAGRFGGEEFVVVLKKSHERVAEFFNSVRERCRNNIFKEEKLPDITFSMGISETEEFYSSFEKADQAMYFSKKTGRDRFTFFRDIKLNIHTENISLISESEKGKLLFGIIGIKELRKDRYLFGDIYIKRQFTEIMDFIRKNINCYDIFIYRNECVCFSVHGSDRKESEKIRDKLDSEYAGIYGIFNLYPGLTEFRYIFSDTYDAFLCHDLFNKNRGIVFYDRKVMRITGEYFFRAGNFSKSYRIYRRAFFLNRKNDIAFNNLISSMIKTGKMKSAEILCIRNSWADSYAEYFINLSNIMYKSSRFEDCHIILIKGLEKFPDNPILLNNLKEIRCILNI